jgi:competence protein ComEC
MSLPKLKRTTLIVLASGAFLVGLWLAHLELTAAWWMLATGIVAALASYRWRTIWPVALTILALTLGIWRSQLAINQTKPVERLFGQKIELTGTVADDPAYTDKNYTEFTLSTNLPGPIKVRSYYVRLQRGYTVRLDGKLESVLGGKLAQIGFASNVQVLSTKQSWLEQIRQRFFAGMHTALPEPLSSFALGLLLGTRALIPKSLQNQLAAVGLSHLVAVSGYNLTILVDAFKFKRLSAFLKLVLPLWLIGTFVVLTGFSASVVRAAVVSLLSLLAVHYGRKVKPMVVLGLSAVITTAWQPSYLWSDLGWQLSFLAFFGILVLAPAVIARISKKKDPSLLLSLGIESLAAQIMTAPLIMASFGTASIISPLTNLVILPLVPLAMLFGLVAGLAGMFTPLLVNIFAWPADYLLRAMISFVEHMSQPHWASSNVSLSPLMLAGVYGLIVAGVLLLRRTRYNKTEALGLSDSDEVQGKPRIVNEPY